MFKPITLHCLCHPILELLHFACVLVLVWVECLFGSWPNPSAMWYISPGQLVTLAWFTAPQNLSFWRCPYCLLYKLHLPISPLSKSQHMHLCRSINKHLDCIDASHTTPLWGGSLLCCGLGAERDTDCIPPTQLSTPYLFGMHVAILRNCLNLTPSLSHSFCLIFFLVFILFSFCLFPRQLLR